MRLSGWSRRIEGYSDLLSRLGLHYFAARIYFEYRERWVCGTATRRGGGAYELLRHLAGIGEPDYGAVASLSEEWNLYPLYPPPLVPGQDLRSFLTFAREQPGNLGAGLRYVTLPGGAPTVELYETAAQGGVRYGDSVRYRLGRYRPVVQAISWKETGPRVGSRSDFTRGGSYVWARYSRYGEPVRVKPLSKC